MAENELVTLVGSNGQVSFAFNDFSYIPDPNNPERYICINHRIHLCSAVLVFQQSGRILLQNQHTHLPTPYLVPQYRLLTEMIRQARTTGFHVEDIIRNVSQRNRVAALLMNHQELCTILHRERLSLLPTVPRSLNELPAVLANINRYQAIYVTTVYAGTRAAVLFSNETLLNALVNTNEICVDSTFSAVCSRWRGFALTGMNSELLDLAIVVQLLPHNLLGEAREVMVAVSGQYAEINGNINLFVDYMCHTWFEHPLIASMFGVSDDISNGVEDFNIRIARRLGGHTPRLWVFLDNMGLYVIDNVAHYQRLRQGFRLRQLLSIEIRRRNRIAGNLRNDVLHESILDVNKKVIIVSIFGKTQYQAKGWKTEMLNSVLQVNLLEEPTLDKDKLCDIQGYYDSTKGIVYLHLTGLLDSHVLIQEYETFIKKESSNFLSGWAHMRDRYARALLVLFHISHILILSHPTSSFDYSYVNLFRALEAIRQKVSTPICDILNDVPNLPKDWAVNARPCSPRVLFYFEKCPPVFKDPNTKANIKKLEHALEDQIYHILRKNRVVTNMSSNSLFAIPVNQEFVFVDTEKKETRDLLGYMSRQLIQSCKLGANNSKNINAINLLSFSTASTTESHSFQEFLLQHVNLAFAEGFDDNVGRHSTPAYFEIPKLHIFLKIANKISDFFFTSDNKELTLLHGLLDTDVKFSRSRCNKVLPRALQAYQENLPQHYTRTYHETKLAHAMAVFEMHARGPLFNEFSKKLQEECLKHWKAGRQMCEVLSLTGNPCTNPIHKGGSEGAGGGEQNEPRDDNNELPIIEHCSGVRYICACNCGRCQGPREDPFSLRQANYEYFQMLAKQCGCAQLESIQFPVFQPSTHNFRAAQLFSASQRKDSFSHNESSTSQYHNLLCSLGVDTLQDEMTTYGSGGQSQPNSDNMHDGVQRLIGKNQKSLTPNDSQKIVIEVSTTDSDSVKDKTLVRQPSTTEYLPGMLNTESPAGLLPQFSSWSLVCLGPSSLYSHNLGLQHQTGVLPNSAFLLPWDVTVRLEHQKERGSLWPAVSEGQQHFGQRGKNFQNINPIRSRKSKGGKEFVVKIFVGVEYECPRGHRFMASAPDKVLKATGNGIVKDSGNKVTSSTADMPLYFPCPCRQPNPLIAQLMRIHVVTPKAPVHVTLNPRVQPGPPPCPIFVTGCDEPIKLSQSAYWVLRLPYVYIGDKGPYLPPKEPVSISHGRLLAGMYGISEVVPENKI